VKPLFGIEDLKKEKKIQAPILTIGSFDGLHRGHQEILDALIDRAKETSKKSIALTFNPHPREVLSQGSPPFLLTTIEEKISILQDSSLDYLLIHPFNNKVAVIEPEEFVEKIFVQEIGVSEIIIGYDHHFGKNRRGDFHLLRSLSERWGYQVKVVEPVHYEGAPVSASRIRREIAKGEFKEVTRMLNRPYFFSGTVVKGSKRGKDLGVPTANIQVHSPEKILLPKGVYTVRVLRSAEGGVWSGHLQVPNSELQSWYGGMMNVGIRPTFGEKQFTVEVHIFDLKSNLYGENLTISVLDRIRDERKFSSSRALANRLKKDEEVARKTLEEM
jgi:riboflavin kinase/FMN adenylyltransferase